MKLLYKLIIFLFLVSCGFHQVVIPNLDIAAHRMIRNELDLNREQQQILNSDVDYLLNELTKDIEKYAMPLLTKINKNNVAKLDAKEIQYALSDLYFNGYNKYSSVMAKYIAQLDARQLKHYKEKQKDKDKDVEKRTKDYKAKLVIERVAFFTGKLSQKQIDYLKSDSVKEYYVNRNKERLIRRANFHLKIDEALKSDIQLEREQAVKKVFTDYNKLTYEYFKSPQSTRSVQIIQEVLRMCDKKQLKHLEDKIQATKVWASYLIKHDF